MPLVIARPSVVETTLGITFQIGELPTQTVGDVVISSRTPTSYTITTSTTASSGAESIAVAALPVALDAGTILTFGSTTVTVSNRAAAAATSIQTLPLSASVASAATATTKALVFVAGCTEATVSPQIKNSDTTNYLSGLGMEKVTVGNAKTMNLNFNLVYGDLGGGILRKIAYDNAFAGREFYFRLAFPSGEVYEGVALLESASPQNPVQEKRAFSCTAQIQGENYFYTAPTVVTIS
jgi:hypothetical protein